MCVLETQTGLSKRKVTNSHKRLGHGWVQFWKQLDKELKMMTKMNLSSLLPPGRLYA